MKSKNTLCGISIAVVLQLGMLAGSAQTNIYLFSGSKTNITLPPGTYIITAYGADGGSLHQPVPSRVAARKHQHFVRLGHVRFQRSPIHRLSDALLPFPVALTDGLRSSTEDRMSSPITSPAPNNASSSPNRN
jgi:hypothetical protein